MEGSKIVVKDIPVEFMKGLIKEISAYAVGFSSRGNPLDNSEPKLLGSGTLVKWHDTYAIITADHVYNILPKTGRLGLLLSGTLHEVSIDLEGVNVISIPRGKIERDGPDIAIMVLAPLIGSSIAARQTFFQLDQFQEKATAVPDEFCDDLWIAQGFVVTYTVKGLHVSGEYTTVRFYNFSGLGYPDNHVCRGDFDYIEIMTEDQDGNSLPKNFGGMSGGAVWRISLFKDSEGKLAYRPPIYCGVIYYQEMMESNKINLVCHGWNSIYSVCVDRLK